MSVWERNNYLYLQCFILLSSKCWVRTDTLFSTLKDLNCMLQNVWAFTSVHHTKMKLFAVQLTFICTNAVRNEGLIFVAELNEFYNAEKLNIAFILSCADTIKTSLKYDVKQTQGRNKLVLTSPHTPSHNPHASRRMKFSQNSQWISLLNNLLSFLVIVTQTKVIHAIVCPSNLSQPPLSVLSSHSRSIKSKSGLFVVWGFFFPRTVVSITLMGLHTAR